MRIIHIGDTLVPVRPDTFGARLQRAGFEVFEVQKNSQAFRFRARRPPASPVKRRIGKGTQPAVMIPSMEELHEQTNRESQE
jgi:hypothetical protein